LTGTTDLYGGAKARLAPALEDQLHMRPVRPIDPESSVFAGCRQAYGANQQKAAERLKVSDKIWKTRIEEHGIETGCLDSYAAHPRSTSTYS
jgi:hypothetical protein